MTNAATSLSPAGSKAALAEFLRREAGAATVDIDACAQLAGGAIQENWKLTARIEGGPFAGSHELVLRTDSASYVPVSRPRWQEFGLLQVARRAGVRVPEPLWLDDTGTVFGKPFYLMRFVPGTAEGHRLVKEGAIADPEALTEEGTPRHRRLPRLSRRARARLSDLRVGPQVVRAARARAG
jgi:aminoglycoside phosphotransferase (APT) family kinase protein